MAARRQPHSDATKKAREDLKVQVARRLKAYREVIGMGQGAFGAKAKITVAAYNNIERGLKLPSIHAAMALCRAHNLTLDYIFMGDAGDLPKPIRDAIEALADARGEDFGK